VKLFNNQGSRNLGPGSYFKDLAKKELYNDKLTNVSPMFAKTNSALKICKHVKVQVGPCTYDPYTSRYYKKQKKYRSVFTKPLNLFSTQKRSELET